MRAAVGVAERVADNWRADAFRRHGLALRAAKHDSDSIADAVTLAAAAITLATATLAVAAAAGVVTL